MKHPHVNDVIEFKFAGMKHTGVVTEVTGSGKDKRWVAISNGRYYPCLAMDRKQMAHILKIIDVNE